MVRKDVGVVLKSARSGDTSTVVTFLGRENGKISLIGKGALSAKSPYRGALEIGNLLEVVYYHKEGRTLFFLKEINVLSTLGAARDSLTDLAAALGFLELVENVCYWGSPEERVVDLTTVYVRGAPFEDPLHTYLVFAFRLLEVLGVVPEVSTCSVCNRDIAAGYYYPAEGRSSCDEHRTDAPQRVRMGAEVVGHMRAIGGLDVLEAATLSVDRKTRKRFGEIIHWTYTFHIHGYSLPKAFKLVPKDE